MRAAGSLAVRRVRLSFQVPCPSDPYLNPPIYPGHETLLSSGCAKAPFAAPRLRRGIVVAYRHDLDGTRDSFELLRKAVGEPEGWFRGCPRSPNRSRP